MNSKSLSRYLREYPFLWGIEQDWTRAGGLTAVKVERMNRNVFSREHQAELFLVMRNRFGYQGLYQPGAERNFSRSLARNIVAALDIKASVIGGVKLEYIVLRHWQEPAPDGRSDITIYRFPKDRWYHEVLEPLA